MITVAKKWVTTPTKCNCCGHITQEVFETTIITIDDKEHVKLPDIYCAKCLGNLTFIDFENNNEDDT